MQEKHGFHLPNNGEYAIIKELEGASRPKADCFVTACARSAQNRTVRKNFLGGDAENRTDKPLRTQIVALPRLRPTGVMTG